MQTLKNINLKGKKVLLRCDFNVSFDEKGGISDDFRIKQTIPTIEYLIKKGAKIILITHLGNPQKNQKFHPHTKIWCGGKKSKNQKFSLKPIALRLEELLGRKVNFLDDCIGEKTEKEIEKMKEGEVLLLENLRFYDEEEKNDEGFAKNLAKMADIYINDAFGVCHRNHASIVKIAKYLPSGAGLLLEKEIKILSRVLEKPWRPLIVIIGGVKIATKIGVIEQFLNKADHLLLGGEIANAVLIGKGVSLGRPVLVAREIIEKIDLTNPKLHLPVDGVISLENMAESYFRIGAIGSVKKEEKVYDIGPETIKFFSEIIKIAKMILWSGPLGLFEEKQFEKGTKEIAQSIARNQAAFKIVGGGDTVAALNKFGLIGRFDHISTGGGAMLEFLSGEKLPGMAVLEK